MPLGRRRAFGGGQIGGAEDPTQDFPAHLDTEVVGQLAADLLPVASFPPQQQLSVASRRVTRRRRVHLAPPRTTGKHTHDELRVIRLQRRRPPFHRPSIVTELPAQLGQTMTRVNHAPDQHLVLQLLRAAPDAFEKRHTQEGENVSAVLGEEQRKVGGDAAVAEQKGL